MSYIVNNLPKVDFSHVPDTIPFLLPILCILFIHV